MKSILIVISCLIFALNGQAQQVYVVSNIEKSPLIYCHIIYLLNAKRIGGTYTSSKGMAILNADINFDSVLVSSIGFHQEKISRKEVLDTIFLKEDTTLLPEIVVIDNHKKRLVSIGYELDKSSKSQSHTAFDGTQYITKIENPLGEAKTIKSVTFYVRKSRTEESAMLKLVLFKNEQGKPGGQLTYERIMTFGEFNSRKIELDISESDIIIPPEGLFIGIEWMGCGPDQDKQTNDALNAACRMAIMMNYIEGNRKEGQTFVRDIFKTETWYDINESMSVDMAVIPAISLLIVE